MSIKENVNQILKELPSYVQLVGAAKTRTPQEIQEAARAGIKIIGENYVQEAEEALQVVGHRVKWHFIGHLQRNKAKKAVRIFDVIETVDSLKIAKEINKQCARIGKVMPVLIEINSGREEQKYGIYPEDTEEFASSLGKFNNIHVHGLMTMGPFTGNPENARPYFQETKKIFDKLNSKNLPRIEMKILSMGMTNSYKVAVQEGANMVRIGTKIFGIREYE
ncbi:YggS family pyridoxal phosphate-dependent enzyme [bacterium]|nr:YggS family pyridoxal phosphate-dependent enzyme [bacterium]